MEAGTPASNLGPATTVTELPNPHQKREPEQRQHQLDHFLFLRALNRPPHHTLRNAGPSSMGAGADVKISVAPINDANIPVCWACYKHIRIQHIRIEILYARDAAT